MLRTAKKYELERVMKIIEDGKEFLKEQVKTQMTYYEEWLEVTETKELNQLQQRTLVESLNYDEEKNQYCVKGYRK